MYRILVRYQIPCQTLWHGCQPLISLGLRHFGTGAAIGGMILDYGVSVLTYIEGVSPIPLRAAFAPPLIFSSGCHWQGCSLTYCKHSGSLENPVIEAVMVVGAVPTQEQKQYQKKYGENHH
jgi:hypothetical protein